MSTVRLIAWKAVAVSGLLEAGIISGDERKGEQLFESEQCIQCHSVNGRQ
jgi:mono/diheme cytochrome c family protein